MEQITATLFNLEYNIIHHSDKTLLLDYNSGFLLKLTPEMNEILCYINTANKNSITELEKKFKGQKFQDAIKDLANLIKAGFLVKKIFEIDNFRNIRLHLTDECNLNCKYCFETKKNKKSMDLKTAKKAVDFLIRHSPHNEVKVIFFGGEPLMKYPLIKEIVNYGEQAIKKAAGKKIRFSISTNGTLLNDMMINYLCEHNIGILISFDGKTHASFRATKDDYPTHILVHNNIKKLVNRIDPDIFAVAVTIHHYNKDIPEILQTLIDLNIKNIKLNFESCIKSEFSLTREDFEYLINQTDDIFEIFKKYPEVNLDYYSLDLNINGSFMYLYHCVACHNEITVGTDGNIYPCSLFIDRESFRLGNVNENKFNHELNHKIKEALNRSNNHCSGCDIRRICGGHCLYESLVLYGQLEKTNGYKCSLYKKITSKKIEYYLSMAHQS